MTPSVPDPTASDEQHARFHGDDLAQLDALAIRVELRAIETALATTHRTKWVVEAGWLRERCARLRARLAAVDAPVTIRVDKPRPVRRIEEFSARRRGGEWR